MIPTEPDVKIPGIDVSHYDGVISWPTVSSQIKFVFIKATDGSSFVDPLAAENAKGASDNSVPCGLYHYFRGLDSEAKHFLEVFNKIPSQLPPVLDLEIPPSTTSLSRSQLADNAFAFLEEISKVVTPLVYLSPSYAAVNLNNTFIKYPLWIADYTNEPAPDTAFWLTYSFWQWSNQGHIDGIESAVDLDWCANQVTLDSFLRLPT